MILRFKAIIVANVSMFLANPFKPDLRVKREALSLSQAGHVVRILAWDRECSYPRNESIDGVRVIRFQIRAPYGSFLHLIPGFLLFYLRLLLVSMRNGVDVVHCHDMDTLVPGIIVSKLKRAKVVYDMHESYPDFISTFAPGPLVSVLRFLEPLLIRRADLVIVTSSMIGDIARRAGADNVVTVMNCFDPFPPLAKEAREIRSSLLKEKEFLVIYIGGFFPGRGLEEVTQAVAMVNGVKLLMCGYGPLEDDLKRLAKRTKGGDRIIFGGEVDPAMVPRYDAAADLLFAMYKAVDPNNVLTIPNKFFESIAAGKPILVSDLGEKGRLVSEEGNGIAVDPDDIQAISDAIRTLKQNRSAYEAMVSSAKGSQERYNWTRMAAKLTESYSRLLA